MKDDRLKEYVEASEALANWFISQGISVGRANGIMMYLAGIAIGETAQSVDSLKKGCAKHQALLEHMAGTAFLKKNGVG